MKQFKFGIVFLSVITFSLLLNLAVAVQVPAEYASENVPLDDVWLYEIEEANGVVQYFDPVTFASLNCTIEAKGTIELKFIGFYEYVNLWTNVSLGQMPYFNITFRFANGEINRTIANQSNVDLGFILLISIGDFIPGFYAKKNWTNNDKLALAEANTPADDRFLGYKNGTLTIKSFLGTKTYSYMQNPTKGNQNVTLSYAESTGILKSFESEYSNYHLKAKLKSSTIPGFPLEFFLAFAFIACILIWRKSH